MPQLPDLEAIRYKTTDQISNINLADAVSLSEEAIKKLYSVHREELEIVDGRTLRFVNGDGQSYFISAQEFPLLLALTELVEALDAYDKQLNLISIEMGFNSRTTRGTPGFVFFGKLPTSNIEDALTGDELEKLRDAISSVIAAEDDRERMYKFFSDPDWGGLRNPDGDIGKKFNRKDWLESAALKIGKMVAAANAHRVKLVRAIAKAGIAESDLIVLPDNVEATSAEDPADRITGADNILFYGAPGTGKSHGIRDIIEKNPGPDRVTVFHPDMQNSDFAGMLKPGLNATGEVTYAFRPGPFALAVAEAWSNPAKRVYLVIEELNRAVAAAVFGELFQLLDRKADGSSCYPVDFPSPEFANWFSEKTGITTERLSLPSNLWILATMNSADQGVFPLDTAFRRRWTQKYVKIDYDKAVGSPLTYTSASGSTTIDWRTFVKALNDFLVLKLAIAEDRLLGAYFLNDRDLSEGVMPGKLLIYLWDDLLRHHDRAVLFEKGIRTYGELDKRATESGQIFSDAFLEMLEDTKPTSPEPE